MSKASLRERLESVSEITLNVEGGRSGRDIPRSVWFVMTAIRHICFQFRALTQIGITTCVQNFLADPTLKISVNGVEGILSGKPITESGKADDVVKKFKSKYGESDVKKYYPKTNVTVGVPL